MRIGVEEWGLRLAEVTALRSTCLRRAVGCVLIDRYGHVMATGYNGVARGVPHCNERVLGPAEDVGLFAAGLVGRAVTWPYACPGASSPSGTDLGGCDAVHAEENALMQCRAVGLIDLVCVTTSPCRDCMKMLMNTGARRIVFRERYAHDEALATWTRSDVRRTWAHRGPDGRVIARSRPENVTEAKR